MPRLKVSACRIGRIFIILQYGDLVSLRLLETAESTKAADTTTTETFFCSIHIFRELVSTDSISMCLRCPGEDGVVKRLIREMEVLDYVRSKVVA
jgi:hypothetical protein